MSIAVAITLIYGGIVDWKRREIPNLVPVALLIVGLALGCHTWYSVAIWLWFCVGIWFAMQWHSGDVPGGDFKLICGLLFAIGFVEVALVLGLAIVLVLLVGWYTKAKPNRHVPLCTYVAMAYCLIQLFLGGNFI